MFSDSEGGQIGKNTCDPIYRSPSATGCQGLFLPFCSGADLTDPTDISWIGRWMDPLTGLPVPSGCLDILENNLFNLPGGGVGSCPPLPIPPPPGSCQVFDLGMPINASGYNWASQLVTAVFEKYSSNGFIVGTLPGTIGFNEFQDFLYTYICCQFPSLCSSGLSNVCSSYSAQRLSLNPEAANWCGCYLPIEEYATYIDKFQINKECTPMCNRIGAIPLTTLDNQKIGCEQDICLIDNVTINLLKTQVGAEININQFCSGCSSNASCTCVIENNTLDSINSSVGGGFNIGQFCQSSNCVRGNSGPDGNTSQLVTVPCDTPGAFNPFAQRQEEVSQSETTANNNRTIYILIIVGVAIGLLILAAILIRPIFNPSKGKVIHPPKPSTNFLPAKQ